MKDGPDERLRRTRDDVRSWRHWLNMYSMIDGSDVLRSWRFFWFFLCAEAGGSGVGWLLGAAFGTAQAGADSGVGLAIGLVLLYITASGAYTAVWRLNRWRRERRRI